MEAMPITGEANSDLFSIDHCMIEVMRKWSIPGGQCAVAKDGRLVYARGFGTVDQITAGAQPPPIVSPTARFRIASSSKPITAVAVLRLLAAGNLQSAIMQKDRVMITADTLRRFAQHIVNPEEHAAALEASRAAGPSIDWGIIVRAI
jgi:Beta-lactamase